MSHLRKLLIGILTLGLSACIYMTSEHPAVALAAVEIPQPLPNVRRPALLLRIQQEAWDSKGDPLKQEYDLKLERTLQKYFIEHAQRSRLFSSVFIDPFDAPKANYVLDIVAQKRAAWDAATSIALVATFGFIGSHYRKDLALKVSLSDAKGQVLKTRREQNGMVLTMGLTTFGLMAPERSAPPRDIEEELIMKTLRWVALSGIYAPVVPASPSPVPATQKPKEKSS